MRYADNHCTYEEQFENGTHFYRFTGKCVVTGAIPLMFLRMACSRIGGAHTCRPPFRTCRQTTASS